MCGGRRPQLMKETLELRVDQKHASRVFGEGEGVMLGDIVRKIVLSTSDPRLPEIAALHHELRAERERLFFGWTYRRRYTRTELRDASLVVVSIGCSVHLSGDVAGTVYDTVSACPV